MLSAKTPQVADGVLDLREWDLEKNGPVALRGEWNFYWSDFIKPETFGGGKIPEGRTTMKLPRQWNGFIVDGEKLSGAGYATFHIKILLAESEQHHLAFNLPGWETAYILYINGREISKVGVVGTSEDKSTPSWNPHAVCFAADGGTLDVVLHVSNFHHHKGGLGVKAVFGTEKAVRSLRDRNAAASYGIAGSLFIIALYYSVLFLHRKKDKSALYFGLFSFLMSLRMLVIGDFHLLTLVPDIPWTLLIKFTYLSFTLGMLVFIFYLRNLFPEEMNIWVSRIIIALGALYSCVVIFVSPRIFTQLLFSFQIVLVLSCLFALFVIISATIRKREDALSFLIIFIFFFLCITNDVMFNVGIIQTAFIVPYGFVAFIFFQAVLLSRKYNRAFIKIEELFQEKTKLEGAALTLKNLSYIDSLTAISNRRRFDEYFNQEWRRARRSGSTLSLIMIDIDFFKQFNDSYGHKAGDEALVQVARAIETSLNRPADLAARYGGEEFIVLLPNTDLKGAVSIAEKIRSNVLALTILHEHSKAGPTLSISLGCASVAPTEMDKAEDLIKTADKALYRAKERGRNRTES